MVFEQIIKEKTTGNICNIAEITAVAVDMQGRLIRRLPEKITNAFDKAMN